MTLLLTQDHLKKLRDERGIALEVIHQRRYQSLPQPEDLIDRGFTKTQAKTAPVLGIPLWNVHGQPHGWQIRPDHPRQFKDGRIAKYEIPTSDRLILDVHPSAQPRIGDPQEPLWVTEGVPKADSLTSLGLCTIALVGGVWGFRGKNSNGGKVILPDWEYVALNGREVIVVYDSDIYWKPDVDRALRALYRLLRDRSAIPRLVQWPEEYRQQKWGVDDFLAQGHTLDELLAMLPPMGPLPASPVQRNGQSPGLPPQAPDTPTAITTTGEVYPYSDAYNALALVRTHGHEMRYCSAWKAWLTWTGSHWERDTTGLVLRWQRQTIKALGAHLSDLDEMATNALLAHIKASLNTARLKAAVEQAQSWEGVSLAPEAFDADPWVLNCANGTLDLRTGEQRDHRPSDLLTKCLATPYDPMAQCPTWERFQWRIMGGSQGNDTPDMSAAELESRHTADARATRLIRFKQRFAGYALTGDTREQCLCLYHGGGSNGKTTEVETLKTLFEDYAQSTPSASLLVKERQDGIPNDIARLRGARLVTAVEIGEGKRLDEELVKRLTGQDTMTARFLHAEFFDFTPQFKLIVACNHLPHIRGTDHAIWRRLHRIPFTVTIPETEQDKTLPAALRAELPGILRWLVQGCLDWQREGLGVPEEVKEANKGYRVSMDVIGRFIEECCVVHEKVQVKASDLYTAYKHWCEASGEYAITLTAFGNRLEDEGFHKRVSNGVWRLGIGLPSQVTE